MEQLKIAERQLKVLMAMQKTEPGAIRQAMQNYIKLYVKLAADKSS